MGSPPNEQGRYNDEPQHRLRITRRFGIGKYPVTQGQYEALMGENPSHFANVGPTAPVGRKRANPAGLHDTLGNVWEWCWDWHGELNAADATDPSGPDNGPGRVVRGGAWSNYAQNCRAACCYRLEPGRRDDSLGFRVAAVQPGELRSGEPEGRRR